MFIFISRKVFIRRILAFLACLFIALSDFTIANAAEETNIRTVKAGIFFFDGYHMKDETGKLTGYGIEFLNLVSKYSHLNFGYAGYEHSWGEMLTMLENGEIDVVTSARKTPEREERFAFSLPIGRNSTILSVNANDARFKSGDYKSYDGMKIGVLSGSSQNYTLLQFAQDKEFTYEPKEYYNSDELSRALADGDIDAILTSNLRRTANEKVLDTLETENFYAIARKDDTALIEEINYAIEQINLYEGDWSNELFYKYYGRGLEAGYEFTERELAYIQDVLAGKKNITVTAIGDRAPYSYVENGELKGIIPDYFAKVMEIAGLPYEIVVPKDRNDYYDMVDTNGVDVVMDRKTSYVTTDDSPYRGFTTDAYLTAGIARVTRKDFSGNVKTVAVAKVQGDVPLEKGLTDTAEVLNFQTREEALQAVFDGKADVTYVYTYTAQMFANNDLTGSMRYSVINGSQVGFEMYVRDTCDHELVTILNKGIHQMPQDTFNQLIAQYTSYAQGNLTLSQYLRANPDKMTVLALGFALTAFVIVVLFLRSIWNRKLLLAVEKSNKDLEAQLAIVAALSRDYVNVYALNTKDDAASIIKLEGYVVPGLDKNSNETFPYTAVVNKYINGRVHPDDREKLAAALSLETVVGKLASEIEYSGSYRVLVDGEVHNFQFTYVKIEGNALSKESAVLAGFRNIDDMVVEEQKQKAILAEALAQAQHANHAKTTFLNNMSHDIRTPMNAIIGFTSLAASHIDKKELVQSYLDKIMTSSRHLLSLINDVLDMSRIESGKVKIEEREASLPEIMHDLKTIVQSDIKSKQLEFYIDTLDVTNENIICDKLRLNQVLLNVLSNAMKYTKPGGMVSVRIIQTPDPVEGYASYQFKIKDSGIGMSDEFLKRMFEPFEREQTATVSGIQGSGLGLAITKNIIDMMNGTVKVESEVGKGTEFTVAFRFRIADSVEKAEYLEQLANLRALVADDDINTCISVSKMLSSIGLHPDWTTQGKEAVVRAEFAMQQNDPYNVYIIDWLMPDMNGIEVVRRIRRIIGEMAVIIVLTAYDWTDIEEEAKEAGVTAFCSKPIFLSELRGILVSPYVVQADAQEQPDTAASFAGKKILLVEDNEINQEIAKAILEEAGFALDIVGDGTEAVDVMKTDAADMYDLILMDIQMPIMNGYEAAREIRAMQNPKCASIPIVAMTANAFDEDRQKAFDVGMNGHVAKPIDIANLFETLQEILRKC